MHRTNSAIALAALAACAGCAAVPPQNKDYAAYLAAQQVVASKPGEPLLRIKAAPGQTIELKGVELLEVYAPPQTSAQQHIAPPPAQPSPGLFSGRGIFSRN